jgi:hypothetical protein
VDQNDAPEKLTGGGLRLAYGAKGPEKNRVKSHSLQAAGCHSYWKKYETASVKTEIGGKQTKS